MVADILRADAVRNLESGRRSKPIACPDAAWRIVAATQVRLESPRRNARAHPVMLQVAILTILLYTFWILMSGFFTPFLLAAGFGSALAVAWLAHRMEVADREGHPFHLSWAALTYWPWLAKEILKSAVDVARVILDPALPASPTVVRFRPRQGTVVGLVTHANSITLTPGTLAIEVGRDEFMVHALTREGAAATVDSDMDRRVERFEGDAPHQPAGGA